MVKAPRKVQEFQEFEEAADVMEMEKAGPLVAWAWYWVAKVGSAPSLLPR